MIITIIGVFLVSFLALVWWCLASMSAMVEESEEENSAESDDWTQLETEQERDSRSHPSIIKATGRKL